MNISEKELTVGLTGWKISLLRRNEDAGAKYASINFHFTAFFLVHLSGFSFPFFFLPIKCFIKTRKKSRVEQKVVKIKEQMQGLFLFLYSSIL